MSKLIMVGMGSRPEIPDTGKVLLYARGKKLRALDEDGKEFNLNQDGWGAQFRIASINPQSIGVGYKGFIQVPYDCYITKMTLAGNSTGTGALLDIWKTSTYPPIAAGSIIGGNLVMYSGTTYYENSGLTGWATGISEGDFIGFYVTGSTATLYEFTISLFGKKI
jgi:hypothetical protein